MVLPAAGKTANIPSTPRVFSSYRFFAHLYKSLEGGLGHAHQGVVHPMPTRPLCRQRPNAARRARERSAQFVAENFQIENAARKSADNIRTNRQLQGAWPMGHLFSIAARLGHDETKRYLVWPRSSRAPSVQFVRRSADKTWQRRWGLGQRAGARDWLLGGAPQERRGAF